MRRVTPVSHDLPASSGKALTGRGARGSLGVRRLRGPRPAAACAARVLRRPARPASCGGPRRPAATALPAVADRCRRPPSREPPGDPPAHPRRRAATARARPLSDRQGASGSAGRPQGTRETASGAPPPAKPRPPPRAAPRRPPGGDPPTLAEPAPDDPALPGLPGCLAAAHQDASRSRTRAPESSNASRGAGLAAAFAGPARASRRRGARRPAPALRRLAEGPGVAAGQGGRRLRAPPRSAAARQGPCRGASSLVSGGARRPRRGNLSGTRSALLTSSSG